MSAVCSLRVTGGIAVASKVNQQEISPGKTLHKEWRAEVTIYLQGQSIQSKYTYGLALACEEELACKEELASAFLKVIIQGSGT